MIWTLLELCHLVRHCNHCGDRFWVWQLEPAGPLMRFCHKCFDYLAGAE